MFTLGKKKGFTITELVIVIVVIAILAAVLIPTFASLIKKANLSSDTQLAKNMNTAISMAESDGKEVKDFTAVQAAIYDAGYILGSLNPTAGGNYFVWESDSNQIIVVNEKMKIVWKLKDIKDEYSKIDGGTWYIAINDTSLLESVEGAVVIPSMTNTSINGEGEKVKELVKESGTVTLSEPITITTAPKHSDGVKDDGIRIKDGQDVTLDLNGQTFTSNFSTYDYRTFQLFNGKLTLTNGAVVANNETKGSGLSLYGIINVGGNGSQTQNLHVNNAELSFISKVPSDPNQGGSTININDKNATALIENTKINVANAAGIIVAKGTATIKNTTIVGAGDAGHVSTAVAVSNGGTATIESGVYSSEKAVVSIYTTGGTLNIKGGSYRSTGSTVLAIYKSTTSDVSKVVITGGTFNDKDYSSLSTAEWKALCGNAANLSITGAGTSTVTIIAQ